VARGDERTLSALEEALRRGPSASRVDSVQVEDHAGDISQDDFVIR